MTQIQYDIRIAIDIHGNLVILEELNNIILKEDFWSKLQKEASNIESKLQPLDDFLVDADLCVIEDEYESFKDNNGNILEKGGIYICSMIWTHSSSFNGDVTEYDSDYEFKNFIKLNFQ